MNKVFLIGNLTRDPELTETPKGVKVCRFSIAVNRNYANADGERQTDFFNITAWRGLGETIAKYMKKGNKIAIEGTIELRTYEDNKGVQRTAVDIIAQEVDFLSHNTKEEKEEQPEKKPKRQIEIFEDDGDMPF